MKAPYWLGGFVILLMSVLMANILINDGMDHGVGFDVFLAGSGSPWQLFINNDLVTGLLFTCGWIIFREKGSRTIDTVAWVWMVLWWGNIIIGAYVIRAACQARGDWSLFFLGRRAGALAPVAIGTPLRILAVLGAIATTLWTAHMVISVGFAGIPTTGLVLGFAPVVLTFLLLALPGRPLSSTPA